jgi:hypothetical protein
MLSNESNQSYLDTRLKTQQTELQMKESLLHLKSCVLRLLLYLSILGWENVNLNSPTVSGSETREP